MKTFITSFVVTACLFSCVRAGVAADDIVIADFEGDDYGAWKAEGTAFGTGPARGNLPGQMAVGGYQGKGLVNSFKGGDGSTGKLSSPPFTIQRKFLNFLIGGGMHPGQTSVNLLIDGNAVRTTTGPNDKPGGTENLSWASWDVTDLIGKTATIEIVDQATGGWGHINVDQITQSDMRREEKPMTREMVATDNWLFLPVRKGAPKRNIKVFVDGRAERFFEIELAGTMPDSQPEWWAPLDMAPWRGRKITVQVDKLPAESTALDQLSQSNNLKDSETLYREPLRGQFHFSPRRGWNNDPNGMVYSQGEYHLYFQLNPYGWDWGNMHWGHAVSRDMVHWQELPIALYPHGPGDAVFSGSAIVDKNNTSGWKKGDNDLLVAAYTSTGRGECIVYSNDKGRTWSEYEGNPVVKHVGRDPRLFWHAPSGQWIMALYNEDGKLPKREDHQGITFYTSPNLKTWTFQSRIGNFFECPDLFELSTGDGKTKWVLTGANSEYMIGQFDGKQFVPETGKLPGHRGRGYYAAQTFTNEPRGRIVQMGWFQTATPGMPFNQSMSIPLELKLKSTPDGPRMSWTPVNELESLRAKSHSLGAQTLSEGSANPLTAISGELFEIRAEFEPGEASEIAFDVRGVPIVFDVKKQEISVNGHRAPAPLQGGKQRLVIFADRTGLEVFAADGLTFVPMPVNLKLDAKSLTVSVKGGTAKFSQLDIHELKSAWTLPAAK